MKNTVKTLALLSVLALGVSACGSKPSSEAGSGGESSGGATTATESGTGSGSSTPASTPSSGESTSGGGAKASNKKFKGCMVSDSGGFDDKSFNQTSYKGLLDAVKDLGISKAQIESHSNSDYKDNIQAMVSQHCNIIVTVGFLLAKDTLAAAKKNPNVDFAIVDYKYTKAEASKVKNLKGLIFNTAQPAFLAGYLAAGMTKSGVVGTFGGQNIPTVTIYMDGFWEGVEYYNKKHNKSVKVVGWDEKTQQGLFTNDFEDKNKGSVTAQNLTAQGADILFPVAGPAGLGALQTAKQSGGKVNAIWVDTDGCVSAPEYCGVLLTSATKGMDVAVEKAIKASLQGNFSTEPYVGTLENNGVGLAPYHQWDSKIPDQLKQEIKQLKDKLSSGEITLKSKSQPK